MSNSSDNKHKRRSARAVFLATLFLLALGATVYWVSQRRQKSSSPTASSNLETTLPAPPFATKEPRRYQATRISTASNAEPAGTDQADQASVSRVFIARDGDRRREDYDLGGVIVSYLELPSARYALLLSQRVYADLNSEAQANLPADLAPEFSPARLLNESLAESRYELLGNEVVNGRATIKYRVTTINPTDPDALKAETLIWVDQSLGMPVKSETLVNEAGKESKFATELQSLSEEVDSKLFDLPPDFKKVSYKEFERQLKMAVAGQ